MHHLFFLESIEPSTVTEMTAIAINPELIMVTWNLPEYPNELLNGYVQDLLQTFQRAHNFITHCVTMHMQGPVLVYPQKEQRYRGFMLA